MRRPEVRHYAASGLGSELVSPIAHTGHWSVTLLYLAPFAVAALWILRDRWRQSRQGGPREPGEGR